MWRWPGPGFSRKLQNLYGSRSPCYFFAFLFSFPLPSGLSTMRDGGRYIFIFFLFPFFPFDYGSGRTVVRHGGGVWVGVFFGCLIEGGSDP